jgi:mannose/cellobiose epimerase-like protein (N-acyl-D-glucosamine 2-epimerase family)
MVSVRLRIALLTACLPIAAAGQSNQPIGGGHYRTQLIGLVDLYNGGLAGTTGFGAYSAPQTPNADWSGWAQPLQRRDFTKPSWFWNWDNHVIGQSRAIYINAEAHRATGLSDSRFRATVQKSADFLIATSWDATYGGFFWGSQSDGANPPTHTANVWGPRPTDKDAYGAVHPVFSLAHAYAVTQDPDHLAMALTGWQHFKTKHADPGHPGGYLPSFNRDYSQQISGNDGGQRNLDYMCHAYESLLALYDVTTGSTRAAIAADANAIGNHIVSKMVQADPNSPDRAYIPWRYDANWTPDLAHGTSPGHQVEYAYLLSRGVERGLGDATWLPAAEKLIAHTLHYAWDPGRGIVNNDYLTTPDFASDGLDCTWWPNAEAARAFAYFVSIRGRADLTDELIASLTTIQTKFVDPVYGGWFASLNPTTLAPTSLSMDELKGHPWKAGYHETMLYAELARLSATIPEPGLLVPLLLCGAGLLRHRRPASATL